MAESLREQALVQVVTRLQGMTGVRHWGGTYANAPRVERIFREPAQVGQLPHLIVLEGGQSQMAEFQSSGLTISYRDEFDVLVLGYINGDDQVTPSTWLQRLLEDVRRTLLADWTLGGLAGKVSIGNEDTDEGALMAAGLPLAMFAQGITVTLFPAYAVQ